jgi:cytosine/adenosine deaminase-related metal-dependent hydrolase
MHVTRPILSESPIRAISYGEVIGLGKRRSRFEELFPLAIDKTLERPGLNIGISPHAPYTVEPDGIRRCLEVAREELSFLTIHLAETPYEEEFIRHHTGPLKEMWERLGAWEDFPERFDGTPVAYAKALGLIDFPTVLAHVNYCTDDDLAILAGGTATVAYCPRTHRYFGHPPHRWREMIGRGVNVVIGTDSCASSPDLNLVDELRLLHEIAPDWPVEKLWEMVTVGAWHGDYNTWADFTVFPVTTDDPLREILETDRLPSEVWIGGQRIQLRGTGASPVKE